MKTIGLIGGMSWESTVSYYQLINETIKEKLGGLHSAKILLYSVDFAEIERYQASGDWDKSAEVLSQIAQILEKAQAFVQENPSAHLHLYGKLEAKHNRKMGHVTLFADDAVEFGEGMEF